MATPNRLELNVRIFPGDRTSSEKGKMIADLRIRTSVLVLRESVVGVRIYYSTNIYVYTCSACVRRI